MRVMLSKEHAMRAYFLEVASLAHEFEWTLMRITYISSYRFSFLLLLGRGVLFKIFNHIDNANILGNVFLYSFSNHYFTWALWTDEDSSTCFYLYPIPDAFLAECMSTFGDYTRGTVIYIEIIFTKRTNRGYALGCKLWHA